METSARGLSIPGTEACARIARVADVGNGELAAGFKDAGDFPDHLFPVRGMIQIVNDKTGNNDIEGAVGEGQAASIGVLYFHAVRDIFQARVGEVDSGLLSAWSACDQISMPMARPELSCLAAASSTFRGRRHSENLLISAPRNGGDDLVAKVELANLAAPEHDAAGQEEPYPVHATEVAQLNTTCEPC